MCGGKRRAFLETGTIPRFSVCSQSSATFAVTDGGRFYGHSVLWPSALSPQPLYCGPRQSRVHRLSLGIVLGILCEWNHTRRGLL